jgi:hypothetical protein
MSVSTDVSIKSKNRLCCNHAVLTKWSDLMSSPQYELMVNIVGIFNILCVVVRQVDLTDSTNFIEYWIFLQFIINMCFLIELVSDFLIHDFFKSF